MDGTGLDAALSRSIQAVEAVNCAAGSAGRLKIGILTPLTEPGWVGAGETMVRGACLAAEYVRERGGIAGNQLEFVLENDQATATQEPMSRSAVAGMAKLGIVDNVIAVLGQWQIRTVSWVVELSHRLGIPHFVTTGDPDVTARRYRTVFRTYYTTTERAEIMVRYMKAQGGRRIGLLVSDKPFGVIFGDAVQGLASAEPGSCEVLRLDYEEQSIEQARDRLRRVKEWRPDFIVAAVGRRAADVVINVAGDLGLRPAVPLMVPIAFPNASIEFWKGVGVNGEQVIWPTTSCRPGWSGLTAIGRWFVDHYTERYGAFPPETAMTAFTDVMIIAQGLERAGRADRDGLITALESGSFDSWRGPITFERGPKHWHHSPAPIQLMQYRRVGESFAEAAVVYSPPLRPASHATPTPEMHT